MVKTVFFIFLGLKVYSIVQTMFTPQKHTRVFRSLKDRSSFKAKKHKTRISDGLMCETITDCLGIIAFSSSSKTDIAVFFKL